MEPPHPPSEVRSEKLGVNLASNSADKKGHGLLTRVPTILKFLLWQGFAPHPTARRGGVAFASAQKQHKTRCYFFPLLSSAKTLLGDFHSSIMPSSLRSLSIIAIIGRANTPSTPKILRPKYIALSVTKGGSPS